MFEKLFQVKEVQGLEIFGKQQLIFVVMKLYLPSAPRLTILNGLQVLRTWSKQRCHTKQECTTTCYPEY